MHKEIQCKQKFVWKVARERERGSCIGVQRMKDMVEEVKWMRNWMSDCCGRRNPGDSSRGVTGMTQVATMHLSKVDESLFDLIACSSFNTPNMVGRISMQKLSKEMEYISKQHKCFLCAHTRNVLCRCLEDYTYTKRQQATCTMNTFPWDTGEFS